MRDNLLDKDKNKRKYGPSPNHPWKRRWKLKNWKLKMWHFKSEIKCDMLLVNNRGNLGFAGRNGKW